jgi:V-type H+-transporting ATPase subunit E
MNNETVQRQLENMVKFIIKEAEEKAEEIAAKAEEEFTIEKAKRVQAQKLKIMKDFERKEKQVEVQKKIAFSNEVNKSRLRILKAQEDGVQLVLAKAKVRLAEISKPGQKYQDLLKKLILEGMLRIDEPRVQVRCRPEDRKMVEEVLPQCQQDYANRTKKQCQLSIDTAHPLPSGPQPGQPEHQATCSGGVILTALEDRIVCNNTLDVRLNYAFEGALPEIRRQLFGDYHLGQTN